MLTLEENPVQESEFEYQDKDYPACPSCRYPLEPVWDGCPYCAGPKIPFAEVETSDPILIGLQKLIDFWHLPLRDRLTLSYLIAEVIFLCIGLLALTSGVVSSILYVLK